MRSYAAPPKGHVGSLRDHRVAILTSLPGDVTQREAGSVGREPHRHTAQPEGGATNNTPRGHSVGVTH